MGAAMLPRWDPHSYEDDGMPPSPTGYFGGSLVLIVEEIDENGNTVVVVDGIYNTITTTIPPASPLPYAGTTSDPHGLLQKGQVSPSPSATPQSSNPYKQVAPSASASSSSPPPSSVPPTPTPSAADSQAAASARPDKDHSGSPPIGAMIVIPIVIIALLVALFLYWRRRRVARRNGTVSHEKRRSPEDGLSSGPPGYNESTNGLLMTPAAAATPLSSRAPTNSLGHPASRLTRTSQQPVILNTNMRDGAYLTGIDTSDAASMVSGVGASGGQSGHAHRSFDANSMGSADEPPPPYRPRSVPPISRETSLRHPSQGLAVNTDLPALSERNLLGRRNDDDDDDLTPTQAIRNPFDDPEDEDDRGGLTPVQSPRWSRRRPGGDDDSRSMISEFSFEHEHR